MEQKSMSISLRDLEKITKGFSDELKIGSGGYGKVYKGVYNGEEIAVKLLHNVLGSEDKTFQNECANLMRINHPNIVRLVGYCYETRGEYVEYKGKLQLSEYIHRILCFEYLQRGSLDEYLKESRDHDWPTRYKIIKGICEGLDYLHGQGQRTPIFHLDLKPANILLDKSMVPKIADFGLSKLFSGTHTYTTRICIGTIEYMPPEFLKDRRISEKNDVYSLDIIIIQIMAGHTSYSEFREMDDVTQFIEMVNTNWRKRINATTSPCTSAEWDQVDTCIKMAINCVDHERKNRPTVAEIVHILKETEKRFPVEWRNRAQFLMDKKTEERNSNEISSVGTRRTEAHGRQCSRADQRPTPPTMSSLNSLSNRSSPFRTRWELCLNMNISMINQLRKRSKSNLRFMREAMFANLKTGQSIATIQAENIIREQNILAAYDIVQPFCEFVLARLRIVEVQKECPLELREAIASIIFASGRSVDFPNLLRPSLLHLRNLFTTKYGKEFVAAAMELRPDSGVNRTIIEKLSVKAPSAESKLKVVKAIAQKYNLDWDSSKTEAEFNKKYEDLLDGSGTSVYQGQAPIIKSSPVASNSREKPSILPIEDTRKHQAPESPSSPAVSSRTYAANKTNVASQEHQSSAAEISCTSPSSSDVLELAADLVKVKITSQ